MMMRNKYLSFESERLYLRPTTEEDAALIFEIFTQEKAIRFIGDRNFLNQDDACEYIRARTLKQLHELGYGNYTLILKSTGQKVGVTGLFVPPGLTIIDLGYALLPSYEGNGYAREASRRLMQAAKEDFAQEKLSAITHPENTVSITLLKDLGFKHFGLKSIEGYDDPSEYFEVTL